MSLTRRSAKTLFRCISIAPIVIGAFVSVDALAAGPAGLTAEDKPKLVESGPYDLSKTSYHRISALPAYDHEGTRPVNEGRIYEIAWIDRQLAERSSDIRIIEAQLPTFVATSKTPAGAAQIVRDVQARRSTYDRWEESILKRRMAIIAMDDEAYVRDQLRKSVADLWAEFTPVPNKYTGKLLY